MQQSSLGNNVEQLLTFAIPEGRSQVLVYPGEYFYDDLYIFVNFTSSDWFVCKDMKFTSWPATLCSS